MNEQELIKWWEEKHEFFLRWKIAPLQASDITLQWWKCIMDNERINQDNNTDLLRYIDSKAEQK